MTTFFKLDLPRFQSLAAGSARNPWSPSGTIELEDVMRSARPGRHRHLVYPRRRDP